MKTEILCRRLDPRARLPVRNNATDSGLDVFALEDATIPPGATVRVRTGIAVQIAVFGTMPGDANLLSEYNKTWTLGLFVWDRSGLGSRGLKTGGGVVDNGYTGEVEIVVTNVLTWPLLEELVNDSLTDPEGVSFPRSGYTFRAGDKLANVIVQRIELPTVREVDQFGATSRGDRGWGESGR